VKRYTERAKTRFEHMWEIRERYHLREFAEAEVGLVTGLDLQRNRNARLARSGRGR